MTYPSFDRDLDYHIEQHEKDLDDNERICVRCKDNITSTSGSYYCDDCLSDIESIRGIVEGEE